MIHNWSNESFFQFQMGWWNYWEIRFSFCYLNAQKEDYDQGCMYWLYSTISFISSGMQQLHRPTNTWIVSDCKNKRELKQPCNFITLYLMLHIMKHDDILFQIPPYNVCMPPQFWEDNQDVINVMACHSGRNLQNSPGCKWFSQL